MTRKGDEHKRMVGAKAEGVI